MARYSEEESLKLRQHILSVAETMIRKEGIAKLTMRLLAKNARVSPTTPYNLFGTKGQLFIDVMVNDLLADLAILKIEPIPSDSLDDTFAHIDKLEAVVMKKERFVKSLLIGVIQNSAEVNTKPITDMMELLAIGWLENKKDEKFLVKEVNIQILSQQLTTALAGCILLWASNSVPSSHLKLRIKYALLSSMSNFVTEKQRPYIQSEIKNIIDSIKTL